MDNNLEQEVLAAYKSFMAIAFSGNTQEFLSIHDEVPLIIGTTAEEWFESKGQLKQYYEKITGQIVGKLDFRNREIKAKPIEQHHFLITEKSDLFVELDGDWIFLSPFRTSVILRKSEGKWWIFHQHASVPDQHTVAGESLPYAKLKGEYDELKEAIKKRTIELEQSLANLKATQSQLIQSEKLASLGELTAGIAHEIQNPLNFVNNFAELSHELMEEMTEEMEKGNTGEAKTIAGDIKQNLEKINHHGNRASNIVKGMLEHSRASSGVKEPTDINALADEYLRLSYHGLRAKDSSFNANMVTDFDPAVGMVEVIPQDIGRVFLNIINNAFYAVSARKKLEPEGFEPTVTVSSKVEDGAVEFRIKDNGTGIPDDVKARIFQPFFTTKPTGQGTGLGLSLAYDIVTKGHGGTLEVESADGVGTEFVIILPSTKK